MTTVPPETADIGIVGAGPAGALLAHELAAAGHDVVVLEAGPRFDPGDRMERMERELRPAHDREDVWEMGGKRDAFSTSGVVNYALNRARVKGVGGTSLHWGAMTPRLHPEDFEMRSRYGVGTDWPISYDDLEPYYLAAEQAMGVAGQPSRFGGERSGPYPLPAHPFSYSDRLLEPGFSDRGIELHSCPRAINSRPNDGRSSCIGFGTCTPVCPSGAKYSADHDVRKAESEGATVVSRATVRWLEHDDDGERITDAVYVRDGAERRLTADVFVIAAGGVETPRLLLKSATSTYPDGLANTSGGVGRHFMEHPGVKVTGTLDEPTRQHLIGYETAISEQFYAHDEGPEGSMILQPYNEAGSSPLDAALAQSPLAGDLAGGDPSVLFDGDEWGDDLLEEVRAEMGHDVTLKAWVEQFPHPDNRIGVDKSTLDDYGDPVPDVSLSVDDRTLATLERAEAVLHEVLEAAGATNVHTITPPEDPFFAFHHMGTTRMGTDPERSVVGPDCRTHDISNLYVSSSSVFPTGGAANPTLTIAALSLRLADELTERLS